MKSTIKILTTALCIFAFSSQLSAQRWGIEAGYLLTGIQQKNAGINGNFPLMHGFLVGPRVDWTVAGGGEQKDRLLIGAALHAQMRAGRYDIDWYKPGTSFSPLLFYASLPVDLTYFRSIKKEFSIGAYAGLRLDAGVQGSTKELYYLATRDQITDKKPFENAFNRFDASAGVGIAMQYYWLLMRVGYDFPLTNSARQNLPEVFKQHQFKFSIAYLFPQKKKK